MEYFLKNLDFTHNLSNHPSAIFALRYKLFASITFITITRKKNAAINDKMADSTSVPPSHLVVRTCLVIMIISVLFVAHTLGILRSPWRKFMLISNALKPIYDQIRFNDLHNVAIVEELEAIINAHQVANDKLVTMLDRLLPDLEALEVKLDESCAANEAP
jgi:hypothetical protein